MSFALNAIVSLDDSEYRDMSESATSLVRENYSWKHSAVLFESMVREAGTPSPAGAVVS